jgi:hypothetical protein
MRRQRSVLLALLAFLTFAAYCNGVSFTWDPVDGVDTYRFYLRVAGTNYLSYTDVGNFTAFAIKDTDLVSHQTYQAIVTAVNGGGESPPSNEAVFFVVWPVVSPTPGPIPLITPTPAPPVPPGQIKKRPKKLPPRAVGRLEAIA